MSTEEVLEGEGREGGEEDLIYHAAIPTAH